MIEPHGLAQRHQLDMQTPLLTISKAMRCIALRGTEGMLLAGAARYEGRGLKKAR